MAPNLAVRSESWLDLSSICCRDLATAGASSHRLSFQGSIAAKSNISQHQHQQEHLLIRLRQQSYLRNKSHTSSTASSLSNLSDSIDISLADDATVLAKSSQNPLLKRQPLRLNSIRQSLQRRGRPKQVPAEGHQASPIVRSLTSFSERLGDKFSHLRHSCKQFLYNCSNNRDDREEELASQLARLGNPHKRQLTGDWIRRHHGNSGQVSLANGRPKSLEIGSHQQTDVGARWNISNQQPISSTSNSSSTLVSNDDGTSATSSTSNTAVSPSSTRLMNPSSKQSHQQVQPMLLAPNADQEYYLEVAEQQLQQQMLLHQPGQLEPSTNPDDEDYDDYAVPADETCRLERSQVELVQMIGEGQKGYVFLGKLQSKDGRHIQDVAIKTLKYETEQLIERLMREAATMRQLEHPHIIRFIGVCPETPALIAMELAELGELKQYLKLNRQLLAASHLVLFAFQISTALSYLESKQYVHRDVAARNVLVCSHSCVKLADFGLSRNLQLEQVQVRRLAGNQPGANYYLASSRGKLPVRWLAPESLAFRRFTSASDVWMFAVCAWEMFHFGQLRPWASIRNNQVLLAIESGQRLPRPPNCPGRLYQMMLQCWCYAPVQRPKFRDLKQLLWSIYLNERAREQLEMEQRLEAARQLELEQHQHCQLLMQQQQQLAKRHEERMQRQRLKHQLRFASSQSPVLANYSSAASGYSSAASTATMATTADDGHSNNSSCSSSMGSLAKRQQVLAAAAAAKSKQLEVELEPIKSRSSPGDVKSNKDQRIEANMRRFQRVPGQLLQKQRSQGSIGKLLADDQGRRKSKTNDDQILSSRWRQTRDIRPVSELQLAYVDDQDEDDSSSESLHDIQYPIDNKLLETPIGSNVLGKQEPAYEGLQAGDKGLELAARKKFDQNQVLHLQELRLTPHRFSQAQLRSSTPLVVSSGSSAKLPAEVKSAKKLAEEEEQRQLAIHQRLLGNIRPTSRLQAGDGRRSAHLASQQQQQQQVDQSLEILESLIGAKTFSADCSQRNSSKSPISEHTRPARPKAAIFNLARR